MNDEDARTLISRVMRGLNHDLKNPLGAADGYVDLLLQGFRGDITAEQRETLERVRVLIATGVDILEDVVTFTRASIGELRVHEAETDIQAAVRMAMDGHAARAQEAGIALEFEGPGEPVRVKTDASVVSRIVDVLVDNALDYAPDGGRVDVAVSKNGSGATIRVSDDGDGIPAEDRDRVFVAFERGAQPVRPRRSAGIGLGLALARALAQQLGGTLELEGGSTFVLELP